MNVRKDICTVLTFSADDFGSHPAVDRAILDLVDLGIVKAVSVLVTSPNFSVERLAELQKFPIAFGMHLALSDTVPLMPGQFQRPWVTADGTFRRHWKDLIAPILFHQVPEASIVQEWSAQIERFVALGCKIDFLDSHQNLHLLPCFAPMVRALISKFDIPRVRVFRDPMQPRHPLYSFLARYGARAYINYCSVPTFGLFYSGKLTFPGLKQVVLAAKSKHSSFAVMVHPGIRSLLLDPTVSSLNYRLAWQEEYEMLCSHELRDWLMKNDIVLGNFK